MLETRSRRAVVAYLVGLGLVVLLLAIILRGMGRVTWCACGSPIPWSWDIWSSHNSQHAIDPYTFTHVLHGTLLYGVLWLWRGKLADRTRFLMAVVIEACWEILENSPLIIERYREATISLDYFGDSIINSVFDVLACAGGYVIARMLGWRRSVVFVAATELILLLTIRDNLTLNVLMLVYPIEAIKQWQS